MKRKIGLLLAASLISVSMFGCGSNAANNAAPAPAAEAEAPAAEAEAPADAAPADDAATGEIIVFAAASMTETLNQIKETYEAAHPGVTITYNFDSSGTLKTQIEEGADCDIFISAGQKQMNQLDINADPEINTEGLDFVEADYRKNILENKVVLVTAEGSDKGIATFDDFAKALKDDDVLIALGNDDVPVGQYSNKILDYYGIDKDAVASKISYGTNVKEIVTQVIESSCDAGIVYCTDAYSAGLEAKDYATAEMCGQVIYPISIMKSAKNVEAAKDFYDYLFTDDAISVFESVGFSRV
ncbi:MAG: molybdate ABC transporter substrate-binding protein [Lachnospiraceae bacterium]|nr:molybdate ABC transporter substrate-binding protein [Lachnospiraceae bacterium]